MKNITLASGLAIALISVGLVVGCGGGSSGDSGGATLDTQSIDKLGRNVAELIPGCVYTGEALAATLDVRDLTAYRAVYDIVVKSDSTTKKMREAVNETVNGSMWWYNDYGWNT